VSRDGLIRLGSRLHVLAFRLTGGRMGRRYHGNPIVLLTTRGRRSGKPRTTPLLAYEDGDRLVLTASFGGSSVNPGWFHNLSAHPDVTVDGRPYRARVADDEERERLWPLIVERYSGYAQYQARTERRIPLVVLEPGG
jgi:deazaflavin-dependent oxidoreductase (nitroreductase family)